VPSFRYFRYESSTNRFAGTIMCVFDLVTDFLKYDSSRQMWKSSYELITMKNQKSV
jgi:hypothetical protein